MSAIKLFNKAVPTRNTVSFAEINKLAVKVGYLVHPDCCTQEVFDFLKSQPVNYNATFYKSWNDVISKNRFELFLDQIKHYATTYGTDFQGEVWTPNAGSEQIDFANLKVILPITKQECNTRCCDMLYSGIALSSDTLIMCLDLIFSIDIEKVKNKEALMHLHKKFNTVPKDTVEFVRYLVFLATGKTLLIKDSETLSALKSTRIDLTSLVNQIGIDRLAEVFFRFKPIFLALKKGNEKTVNKLRRLANTKHKPMKIGFFEAVLSDTSLLPQLPQKLEECNNFKKILLLQTILIRKKELEMRFFGIRNGKLWAKSEKSVDRTHYGLIYSIIYKSLIDSLSKNKTSVKIPNGVKITLPTSEKSFVGNYPLGTSFDLSNTDSIVGIHWRQTDGANDLDMSLINLDGTKYGWNSHFTNSDNTVVYSGDMTSANPEAVELFYSKQGIKPAIVKVNLFNGNPNSKFKVFSATETITNLQRNYMVNPNNIRFMVDCEMDSTEKMLGVITGDKFILAQFKTGNKIVSGDSITNQYTDYALKTLDCYLDLEKVLIDAGFTINDGNESIDLTNLSKDTLIGLLA
jgi:hypothetical protein